MKMTMISLWTNNLKSSSRHWFTLFETHNGDCSCSWLFGTSRRLGDCEVAIRAVRNYSLTWCQPELFAIELHRNNIGFEGNKVRDSANLGISITIGPCRLMCVTDVVIAAQSFVRTEGLLFNERKR